jgi:hypothetical protein
MNGMLRKASAGSNRMRIHEKTLKIGYTIPRALISIHEHIFSASVSSTLPRILRENFVSHLSFHDPPQSTFIIHSVNCALKMKRKCLLSFWSVRQVRDEPRRRGEAPTPPDDYIRKPKCPGSPHHVRTEQSSSCELLA